MACVFLYKNTNTNPQKNTTYCIHQLFFVILHSISMNIKDYAQSSHHSHPSDNI